MKLTSFKLGFKMKLKKHETHRQFKCKYFRKGVMARYFVEKQVKMGKVYYWISNYETFLIEPEASQFLKYKMQERCSENTIRGIAFAVSYYLTFLDEERLTIEEVFELPYAEQFEHFASFLDYLKRGDHTKSGKCPKNNTCNAYLSNVFQYLNFLTIQNQEVGSLKVLTPKETSYFGDAGVRFRRMVMHFNGFLPKNEHKKREISEENFLILLENCSCIRDKLLLLLLAESGMRIGELLGVNYSKDIDIDRNIIRVEVRDDNENGAKAKYAEYRNTFFSNATKEILMFYLAENVELLEKTEFLFVSLHGRTAGKPMTIRGVYSILNQLEKRTGIKATPHMLRHYFANARRKAGYEILIISTLLGHKHIRTTEEYISVAEEELEAAADEFYKKNGSLYDISKLL